jgi:hypothetical protein
MSKNHKTLTPLITFLLLMFVTSFFVACSGPRAKIETVIEETEGGLELLEREFAECEGDIEDYNTPQFVRERAEFDYLRVSNQRNIEEQFPHTYSTIGEMYPQMGSARQTKAEIMDLVDRHIWSSELNRGVQLLHFFDMALVLNVADRTDADPENSSAQRMQVYVRNSSSNDDLATWDLVQTWPISSGRPCRTANGNKIATFTGVYKFDPTRMSDRHYSNEWDGADMFETMFLYHYYLDENGNERSEPRETGVAIHGTYKTSTLGRRDSGGCIRLYRDNSKCLFETIMGDRSTSCLGGGELDYRGPTASFDPYYGEADPEYFGRSQSVQVDGIRVLVAIYNDKNARL